VKRADPSGRRRTVRWLVPLGGAVLLLAVAWLAGLVAFVSIIPEAADAPDEKTDAIVVLTGGSERLAEGLRLLAAGRAGTLFVSGVGKDVELASLLQGLPPGVTPPDAAERACCIALGHGADNTLGNARETAAWMASRGFRSLRLVTADYHMPRSLIEFRRAMPDIRIAGHPVYPPQVMRTGWWRWPGTTFLLIGEYDKLLLSLARGLLDWLPGRDGGA
jgi:uncharacterized SAM-binding protein YcdF (DUF218 family)